MPKTNNPIDEATRHLKIADHMLFVSYPILDEKKLLIKIFEEIYNGINETIKCIIVSSEFKSETFNGSIIELLEVVKLKLKLNDSKLIKLKEIIELNNSHKLSAVEFTKNNKIVIMSDELKTKTLDYEQVKEYLITAKYLLNLVKNTKKS